MIRHIAALAVSLAVIAPAAAVETVTFNFLTPGFTTANVAQVVRGANENASVTLTATARRFSGIEPNALVALSQTGTNATIRQQAIGLGITGNGDTNQIDTNVNGFREALLVTGNERLRLTGFRVSAVDADDTISVYGVRGDELTYLGFPGLLATGELDDSANVTVTGSGSNRTSSVTLLMPSTFAYDGFLFTSRVNGAVPFLGTLGQGFRLDAVSGITVPEPGTWAMLVLGFGLVGTSLRQRSRKLAA